MECDFPEPELGFFPGLQRGLGWEARRVAVKQRAHPGGVLGPVTGRNFPHGSGEARPGVRALGLRLWG